MVFEPILFGITGAQVKIEELDGTMVWIGVGALLCGIIIRILATTFVAIGSRLNLKEKIFVSLALMAKATVQAALGPTLIDEVTSGTNEQKKYAETVSMVCILSIIIAAPVGAILISISGPKLLTKTSIAGPSPEEWTKIRRPSMRDISIINEEIDLEEEGETASAQNNR